MLMECLAAGRAISLPSSVGRRRQVAAAQHVRLRPHPQAVRPADRQDGRARGAARAHGRDGLRQRGRARRHGRHGEPRREALGASRRIMKYQTTERMRRSVNDAMDLHGGRAICDGPTNYLQSAYQMMPVGITVEGANILTRSLDHLRAGGAALAPLSLQGDPGLPGRRTRSAGSTRSMRRSATTSPSRCRTSFGALLPQRHVRARSATCRRRPTARPNGTASCGAPRATSPSSPT